MNKYCFVGEKRSKLAIARGWTWKDGHLAARQLFDALIAIGVNPDEQYYTNILEDDFHIPNVSIVVAMGNFVSKELTKRRISHIKIIHPAARGIIRKKENYIQHIKDKLI